MPHADMDFNFNADDMQMDIDPAPISLGERLGNTPCPDSASRKQKVKFSCCVSGVRLTSNCRSIKKVEV